MVACENGHEDVVRALVEEGGADVNESDRDGSTPCHIAARNGHVDVIRMLHEYGTDIDKPNNNSLTPSHIAAENGHVDIVLMLIEYGVDITKANNFGYTPLLIAFQFKHTHLLPIFRHAYSHQHLVTPPTLTSYPNHNIFSHSHITHADYLLYVVRHRMSSLDIEGYMDVCCVVRNGMRELVSRYEDALSLVEDDGRWCGLKVRVAKRSMSHECCMALVWWESEGGYEF